MSISKIFSFLLILLSTSFAALASSNEKEVSTNTASQSTSTSTNKKTNLVQTADVVKLKKEVKSLKANTMTFKEKVALQMLSKRLNKLEKKQSKQKNNKHKHKEEGKSQLAALLLGLFLGSLGIHRFYLGYTWQGIVQLLTLGGLGIWALIDIIRIATGDLKPKNGEYAKTL